MGLLDGKVAIVTGSGRGIGRGEALELAKNGAKVVVNDIGGSVEGEGAEKRVADEVVDIIKERGGEAVANYDDISDWSGAKNAVEQAVEAFGGLDIVVNNAGILRDAVIVNMTEEQWDSVLKVHLKGSFAMTHHAANYWREQSKAGDQPKASIVNTVSSAGLVGNVGQANYGAAKAGIAALTRISALELGRYGVRANAIAPGGMTRMVGVSVKRDVEIKEPDQYPDDEWVSLNPQNSAPTVAWLASDASIPVTGQVFRAVGNTIAHYQPWTLGQMIETPKEPRRWTAEELSDVVFGRIFGLKATGLQIGG
ncbi:MAG TPA: SDR family NAD(P)-dependent oxidoreductase [Acidimicrobiia bacterium]|nr:SDR family NAD(P)-dependent oxidoreductase [Acidimicrobiia bacterium]